MGKGSLEIAAELCRKFEGFSAVPYICPAGYWTIGYGATSIDGVAVTANTPPISKDKANELLLRDLERFLIEVYRLCPKIITEPPSRIAAILDFTYNLGSGRLKTSTLRRRINAGDWADVPYQLSRWVYGGGKKLPGLVKRRAAEAALI